jgi:vacuolar-type H+-ATPase subunit F/Vma7
VQAFCIADEDTVRGFRLAGVPGQAVSTLQETSEAVTLAYERPDCALLIVTEQVVASLGPQLATLRGERNRPLVVEIPGPGGPASGAGRESLRRLVQSVVGTNLEEEP